MNNLKLKLPIFNFMIDFELGWGNGYDALSNSDLKDARKIKEYNTQSENFKPFTDMLRELEFKTSWAIVGKLLNPNFIPTEQLKFNPKWSKSDWYELPKEIQSSKLHSHQYIEAIKKNDYFEILSHGLAHIDYLDSSTTREIAEFDIKFSKELLEKNNINSNAFVYPCNKIAYEDVLKENDYKIARGNGPRWKKQNELIFTPIGFWVSPGIYSFNEIKDIIDYGIEKKAFIHPWMHLNECSLKERDIDNFYYPLFEYINKLESCGEIENLHFNQIYKEIKNYEL